MFRKKNLKSGLCKGKLINNKIIGNVNKSNKKKIILNNGELCKEITEPLSGMRTILTSINTKPIKLPKREKKYKRYPRVYACESSCWSVLYSIIVIIS